MASESIEILKTANQASETSETNPPTFIYPIVARKMSKLNPRRTFPYQLNDDRGEPGADTFQLKVLSGEASDELSAVCQSFRTCAYKDERQKLFARALEMSVAAWPWEGSLRSVLTDRECWELVAGATQGAALTVDERKKFVSLPSSETDSSATDAAESAT